MKSEKRIPQQQNTMKPKMATMIQSVRFRRQPSRLVAPMPDGHCSDTAVQVGSGGAAGEAGAAGLKHDGSHRQVEVRRDRRLVLARSARGEQGSDLVM